MTVRWTELVIFTLLFAIVAGLGFYARRWNSRAPEQSREWGLGGRRFGWISWFLVGGEIFTAYTFFALPSLMFGAGAIGFHALPFTAFVYPLAFLPLLRLWEVSRKRGYMTSADFVQGRFGSTTLTLLVAIAGIAATLPYIALQLAGLEAVLRAMGLNGAGLIGHIPLFIAFLLLAAFTYRSGLRAPALIAIVKALLIYLVIVAAVIVLPARLGGWASIFAAADAKFSAAPSHGGGILLGAHNQLEYVTQMVGAALALFLYPHVLTGVLACKSDRVIRRNMVWLLAYTPLVGLFALLGYAAIAANTQPIVNAATGQPDSNTVIPMLFEGQFPVWFAGIGLAAIGIGTLVPASVMSIAAANLYSSNIYSKIYKVCRRREPTEKQQDTQSKVASLVVKLCAVALLVFINPQYSLDLQLIAGVVILQTLPSVAIALYTRWFHKWGLVAGCVAGLAWGLSMLYSIPNRSTGAEHLGGAALELGKLSILGWHPFAGSAVQVYPGLIALIANLVVAAVVTVVLRLIGVPDGVDETETAHRDEGTSRQEPVAELLKGST
ncbi:MAG TPA: sodium:solute symporter family protein [Pseudonocardiaceae bacterium]|nr:sodium:solute symporter family protein [Pseudonocardiaceae bacterium]